MPDITVTRIKDTVYEVVVTEGKSNTTHQVTATDEAIKRYSGGVPPGVLIKASFEFLLEREAKESILRSFELSVIERYFPEYPEEIHEAIDRHKNG